MKLIVKNAHVPSKTEIVEGLHVDADPAVVDARRRVQEVGHERERASRRATEAVAEETRVVKAYGEGRASLSEYSVARDAARVAALVLPQFDQRLADADQAVSSEIAAAKARVVHEATKRRDQLQRIANELTPALNALREAEAALDAVVQPCGLTYGVRALDWPSCLDADAASRNALLVGVGTFRPPAA